MNDTTTAGEIGQMTNWDWTSIVFGFFGVIGTLATFYALYLHFKSKKENDFILKTVQSAINKEETERKLSEIKGTVESKVEELESLSTNIVNLQNKIRQELPIEAKKAVLKDRLEEAIKNLHSNFKDIESTKSKLAALGESNDIPDELRKSIETEIHPKYLVRDELSKQKNFFTIQTTIAAIASAIIPGFIGNNIGLVIMILSIPLILKIYGNTRISEGGDKELIARQIRIVKLLIIMLIVLVLCGYIFMIGLFVDNCIFAESRYECGNEKTVFVVIGSIGILLSLIGTFANIIKLKKENKAIAKND